MICENKHANCVKCEITFHICTYIHIYKYNLLSSFSPYIHSAISYLNFTRRWKYSMKNEHMFVCLIPAPASLPIIKIATSLYTKQMSKAIIHPCGYR